MAQWIEVRARYDKMMENGSVKKVTEPYLADALSCTEAEERVTEELQPFISGEFRILSVVTTKIAEIFWDATGDKFYKVKVNFITIDEKTVTEKKQASYILVQASDFTSALNRFNKGMRGTMADYEIEAISETKIVDVYKYQLSEREQTSANVTDKVASDKGIQRAVKKFRDAVPDGMTVSASVRSSDGTEVVPETVLVDKSKPRSDDD